MSNFWRLDEHNDGTDFLTRVKLATAVAYHVPGGSVVVADVERRIWVADAGVKTRTAQLREAIGHSLLLNSLAPISEALDTDEQLIDAWFVPTSPLLVDMGRGVVRIRRDRSSSWAFATLLTPEEALELFTRVLSNNDLAQNRGYEDVSARRRRDFTPQMLADDVLETTVCIFELPVDAPIGVAPMYGEMVRALHMESVRLAYLDSELDDLIFDWVPMD